MDIKSYKKKIGAFASMAGKAPLDEFNKLTHSGKKKREKKKEERREPSSEAATFDEKKDLSVYADSGAPWFRRWYMFAFVYPIIVAIVLGISMGISKS